MLQSQLLGQRIDDFELAGFDLLGHFFQLVDRLLADEIAQLGFGVMRYKRDANTALFEAVFYRFEREVVFSERLDRLISYGIRSFELGKYNVLGVGDCTVNVLTSCVESLLSCSFEYAFVAYGSHARDEVRALAVLLQSQFFGLCRIIEAIDVVDQESSIRV